MCFYASNFFNSIAIHNISLNYLTGIDNSFVIVQSWDTVLQNTTNNNIEEFIIIENLMV